MKILVIEGSPRENGNTSAMASALIEGATKAGDCEIKRYRLGSMVISPCRACFGCASTAKCVIDDDMHTLYDELKTADAVVFAVPIYWWNMSAQMMLFFNRLTAHLSGGDQLTSLAGKPAVLLVAYNYENCARSTIRMFRDFVDWIGVKLTVVRHCAKDGPVSSMPGRLARARSAGRRLVQTV